MISNRRGNIIWIAAIAVIAVTSQAFAGFPFWADSATRSNPRDPKSPIFIPTATPIIKMITAVAGNGVGGYNGDDIAATSAELNTPMGVAVDSSGNIYFSDLSNSRIRKVTVGTGVITTVAGNGIQGYNGDNIAATSAELNGPWGVAIDALGNIYIAENLGCRIRKVAVGTGIITTVAGNGSYGFAGDNGVATSAKLGPPYCVALDSSGNIYISDYSRIRKVTIATGIITTFAGSSASSPATGDNGPAINATFAIVVGIKIDGIGNLFIADPLNHNIRKITMATGIITTVAGNGAGGYNGDNIAATSAELNGPADVAVDLLGNIYIADDGNYRIRKVAVGSGIITTVAGNGIQGYNGDNIDAMSAEISSAKGVAVDSSGNIFFSEGGSGERVRKVWH